MVTRPLMRAQWKERVNETTLTPKSEVPETWKQGLWQHKWRGNRACTVTFDPLETAVQRVVLTFPNLLKTWYSWCFLHGSVAQRWDLRQRRETWLLTKKIQKRTTDEALKLGLVSRQASRAFMFNTRRKIQIGTLSCHAARNWQVRIHLGASVSV